MKNAVLFGDISQLLKTYFNNHSFTKIFILVDENTNEFCWPIISQSVPANSTRIQIPSGEVNKQISTCEKIWTQLTNHHADRHALLINLGGGVIGDMGGFSAATYKRGISFINIPTTLLSQVDASVGGKLGIDFGPYKNHIGLFQLPDQVFIDHQFLSTLPKRQVDSGFAEVIKHSLIGSINQWNALKQTEISDISWSKVLPGSIDIKQQIVSRDFKETGERKLLNFGHTLGHAVESLLLNTESEVFHGEAIAAGMIMESYLSNKYSNLNESNLQEIILSLTKWYNQIPIPKDAVEEIISLARQDKKNINGKTKFTLINEIGRGVWDVEVSEEEMKNAIAFYMDCYP